ncbi:hypothetical protein PCE1_000160 [Barthelona sp. PCE]
MTTRENCQKMLDGIEEQLHSGKTKIFGQTTKNVMKNLDVIRQAQVDFAFSQLEVELSFPNVQESQAKDDILKESQHLMLQQTFHDFQHQLHQNSVDSLMLIGQKVQELEQQLIHPTH